MRYPVGIPLPARVRRWRALALALAAVTLQPHGAAGRELSRGLPVRWTRPPNYARCTDSADSLQLTDGLSAPGEHIWLDRRCVGWETEIGDPIALYVDLGRLCQLDSVVVCTAVSAPAEVELPSVFGAVGATSAQWTWAGDLDARTLPAATAARARRVRLAVPLTGSGRTVLVIAVLRSHFFFADEVEIHGSELPPGTTAAPASPRGPVGRPFARGELPAVAAAQRRAWAVRAALPHPDAPAGSFANLAVAAEESLRLAARASAWRAAGAAPLRVRRVDPWAPTTPWSELQAAVADTLQLWPGAWGAAAFEAACAAAVPARAALALAATAPGAPLCTLRFSVPVEARDGRWSGDALPLANGTLTVRPGEVRQVWIDLDASGASPGLHVLRLTVGAQQVDIPVRVHRLYPGVPPVHAVDWIYPEKFALTRTAAAEALRDNAAHGIDTWWIPAEALPWPDPAPSTALDT